MGAAAPRGLRRSGGSVAGRRARLPGGPMGARSPCAAAVPVAAGLLRRRRHLLLFGAAGAAVVAGASCLHRAFRARMAGAGERAGGHNEGFACGRVPVRGLCRGRRADDERGGAGARAADGRARHGLRGDHRPARRGRAAPAAGRLDQRPRRRERAGARARQHARPAGLRTRREHRRHHAADAAAHRVRARRLRLRAGRLFPADRRRGQSRLAAGDRRARHGSIHGARGRSDRQGAQHADGAHRRRHRRTEGRRRRRSRHRQARAHSRRDERGPARRRHLSRRLHIGPAHDACGGTVPVEPARLSGAVSLDRAAAAHQEMGGRLRDLRRLRLQSLLGVGGGDRALDDHDRRHARRHSRRQAGDLDAQPRHRGDDRAGARAFRRSGSIVPDVVRGGGGDDRALRTKAGRAGQGGPARTSARPLRQGICDRLGDDHDDARRGARDRSVRRVSFQPHGPLRAHRQRARAAARGVPRHALGGAGRARQPVRSRRAGVVDHGAGRRRHARRRRLGCGLCPAPCGWFPPSAPARC